MNQREIKERFSGAYEMLSEYLNSYKSVGHAMDRYNYEMGGVCEKYRHAHFYILMLNDSEEHHIISLLQRYSMDAYLEYEETGEAKYIPASNQKS